MIEYDNRGINSSKRLYDGDEGLACSLKGTEKERGLITQSKSVGRYGRRYEIPASIFLKRCTHVLQACSGEVC